MIDDGQRASVPAPPRATRRLLVLGRALLAACLITALVVWVGPKELVRVWADARAIPLLLAGAAYAGIFAAEAWRFAVLFAAYRLSYGGALRLTLEGTFFGSFTPGLVGAELYKVWALHRQRPGLAQPLTLVALLRVASVLIAAAAGVPAAFLAAPRARAALSGLGFPSPALGWPGAVAVGAILALALATALAVRRRSRSPGRLSAGLASAWDAVRLVSKRQLATVIVAGGIVLALRVTSLALVLRSLGAHLAVADLVLAVVVVSLASVLPLSLGGLGIQEGVLVACLIAFGVGRPPALGAAVAARIFLWLLALLGGSLLLFEKRAQRAGTIQTSGDTPAAG